MTEPNYELLHQAIELAQGPGVCRYVNHAKPYCVAAQYLALREVTVDELYGLNNNRICRLSTSEVDAINSVRAKVPEVAAEEKGKGLQVMNIVQILQDFWDGLSGLRYRDNPEVEAAAKTAMHAAVEAWREGERFQSS
jgi:hypothetical protein